MSSDEKDRSTRAHFAARPHHRGAALEESVAQRASELGSTNERLEREIAARRETDRALRESEERFRALAEQSPSLIYIFRKDRLVYVNQACERKFGYSRETMCAPDFDYLSLVAPECHDVVKDNLARHLAGEDRPPFELTLLPRNGGRIHAIIHTRLIGEEQEILGVATDITERVRAEDQQREFIQRLVRLREEERRRLAGDLHDLIGPSLTILGINLNLVLQSLPQGANAAAGDRLNDSLGILGQVTRQMREIMTELRPPMLDDYGLVATLRWYVEQFSRTTGFPVLVTVEGHPARLPIAVETVLFRIAQEALTNALKHAGAASIKVRLVFSATTALLAIEDDGRGFELYGAPDEKAPPHWGLIQMRESAEAIGGRLTVAAAPGKGARIEVLLALGAT